MIIYFKFDELLAKREEDLTVKIMGELLTKLVA
jgi:hypothetical protein